MEDTSKLNTDFGAMKIDSLASEQKAMVTTFRQPGKRYSTRGKRTFKPHYRMKFSNGFKNRFPRSHNGNTCKYCKKSGHTIDQCLKRQYMETQVKGYHYNSKRNNGDSKSNLGSESSDQKYNWQANITVQRSQLNQKPDYHDWYWDTVANVCLTPYKPLLQDYHQFDSVQDMQVHGIGGSSQVLGKGSITLTDVKGKKFTFKDVLYVPSAPSNIISATESMRKGLYARFSNRFRWYLTHQPSGFSLQGNYYDGLFQVRDHSLPPTALAVQTRSSMKRTRQDDDDVGHDGDQDGAPSQDQDQDQDGTSSQDQQTSSALPPQTPESASLWHQRFAHTSYGTIVKLPFLQHLKATYGESPCSICIRAKQHKLPHSTVIEKASKPLELVHSDTCGPILELDDFKYYFLTFVDDYTRYVWAFAIQNKKAATIKACFDTWRIEAERQSGFKLKTLRTDGGREYEKELNIYLKDTGIQHQITAPYTPQSNGIAERINRTLLEMIRSMLFQANLPKRFWTYALTAACHIKNILPHSSVRNKTPFELFHSKPPRYTHLAPFGCIVHAFIPPERREKQSKISLVSTRGFLIGYVEDSASYKYYDLDRKRVDVSHNIHIVESEFPSKDDFPDEQPAYTVPTPPPEPTEQREIFDSITVEPPPHTAMHTVSANSDSNLNEPTSYEEAIKRPDGDKWLQAMKEELRSIDANNTWVLCRLPPGRKCIGSKWVFKLKKDGNNRIIKYKARVVAKGYSQVAGLDFDETFAPVVRIESVRVLLALALFYGLYILQVDAKTAFLNGNSDLDLYISQIDGFIDKLRPNLVLKLNKSLYGLKQAPRIWYLLLCSVIQSIGFEPLPSDPSIYFSAEKGVFLAVYVDDILIFGKNKQSCDDVYNYLSRHFKMEYIGPPTTFLGLNITRSYSGEYLAINQPGHINRMLFSVSDDGCSRRIDASSTFVTSPLCTKRRPTC
jgi:Reverse transcriptase (RNA-dependent DNA polymerase)/Integrase core domain/Pol polyprotein, beta-barrel domain